VVVGDSPVPSGVRRRELDLPLWAEGGRRGEQEYQPGGGSKLFEVEPNSLLLG